MLQPSDMPVAHGPRYRLAQFQRSLGAHPDEDALREMRATLTPAQQVLFLRMSPRDQWHSLQTLRLLPAELRGNTDLAVAALLHDAGKGYIHLHERALYVLLAARPGLLARIAAPRTGPRGALLRMSRHAERGAALATAAGASRRAVALIRDHHHPDPRDAVALALLAADERA
jgi:hypothetical protein